MTTNLEWGGLEVGRRGDAERAGWASRFEGAPENGRERR